MGGSSNDFWRTGMLDFQLYYSAHIKKHGIEKPRKVTEKQFDEQYQKAAEILKQKGLL